MAGTPRHGPFPAPLRPCLPLLAIAPERTARRAHATLLSAAAPIPVSEFSKRVHNPIRAIVENIRMPKDPKKPLIPLSIGACALCAPAAAPR